jgi:hypothetical protein
MSILQRRRAGAAVALFALLLAAPMAHAQDASSVVKAMSDYLAHRQSISVSFDADIEVITPELQKLQFTSSGHAILSRPDKVRVTRVGGYADVDMAFDGGTLSIFGKNLNAFAQVKAPGTVDQLVERLRNDLSVTVPGATFLLTHVYDELMADVISAKHIGRGVVDGVECDHLAFRNDETDWQIWIEVGNRPVPRKFVITSKTVTGAPQYTLRMTDWRLDLPLASDAFAFRPPADARQVDAAILSEIDELPPGMPTGAQK